MKKLITSTLFVVTFVFATMLVSRAQSGKSGATKFKVYTNPSAAFTFKYQGTVARKDSNECSIELPLAENSGTGRAVVRVFTSQRPFVYLPGTYGGKYYFSSNENNLMAADRVTGDSVSVNGLRFAQDYWAVYAGMGQWETVDNCYSYHDGRYYVISLSRNLRTGMPGEIVNGIRTSKSLMRTTFIDRMRDTTNTYVQSFSQILKSFSLTK